MREIKFRVWNKTRQVMSYDVTMYANRWVECVYVDGTEDKYPPSVADHFLEVMQFTCLYDKNGKEIYKRDIVSYFGIKYEVLFRNGAFGWMEDGEFYSFNEMDPSVFDEFEVIGNVYENPELLEG